MEKSELVQYGLYEIDTGGYGDDITCVFIGDEFKRIHVDEKSISIIRDRDGWKFEEVQSVWFRFDNVMELVPCDPTTYKLLMPEDRVSFKSYSYGRDYYYFKRVFAERDIDILKDILETEVKYKENELKSIQLDLQELNSMLENIEEHINESYIKFIS